MTNRHFKTENLLMKTELKRKEDKIKTLEEQSSYLVEKMKIFETNLKSISDQV